ncbi:efflux RND transporter periplasmic adaptor subunit [Shewanella loihica]|uniref:Efflux transporter, RND family, MFP subunit n=1 Tax=Shewanella loihica (strain ATCC BAA-1088 / PV-4) TaxID=323850 RepID=A3QAU5_SHELP|nr:MULTISPECIES: HlyD family efflux transporter periplasmic adaptor subunit [Shewanella]ABO22593.1 efflux transporter, RND family, MFP subunit [Shewanella loihica PV-4]QYJ90720.1 HlyD family efflux transporter periplasmic adaptor subunit [Shewanella halotolerans]QYJ98354.1 HlyD family efflux transporter periplasmic adaptor subunit [Shewanella alkalitolerans]QYK13636.1 HlyD family efflux transporter periplasmic adaptor subunit [Shewanella rhizosphaerae]TVP15469.1 efflux transporter periplasmic 
MIKDTSAQDKQVAPSLGRRIKWPVTIGAGVLLVSGLVWASVSGSSVSESIDRSELRFATLERGTLVRDIASTGKIVAANAPILYAPEKGTVTLIANPGDKVEQGQVVATIESHSLTNNLKQQQALLEGMQSSLERARLDARRDQLKAIQTLDMAKVDLEAADRESRRGDQLIESSLISKIDYEKSKDELHKAKLLYAHAQQEAELMKDTLSFELKNKASEVDRQALVVAELERQVAALNITAPVGGIIGNWLTEQKARIGQSQPILTVVDLSAFEAELAVPESYADELGIGMDVELNFGGQLVMGKLSAISPEVRNREVTTRVRFEQQAALHLRQNQRLSARVLLENRPDVLMVKRGPFVNSGGGTLVYAVKNDLAERTEIQLGARSMSHIEVVSGGEVGDQWIISSTDAFKNAEQVLIR